MKFSYTARFVRSYNKLPNDVKDDVTQAVSLYENGGNDASLKLHKLNGKMKMFHAFSANFSYRVIILKEKNEIYYIDVGTHEIYK